MPSPGQLAPAARRRLAQDVAASLDLPPVLLPHGAELFAKLTGLGGWPRRTARMAAGAGLSREDRVLDLGCGKGAFAVALAKLVGCRVVGIDAHAPFVEAAAEAAARAGVARLCRFEVGDARAPRRGARRFDGCFMLGVDPVEEAIPLLRGWTRAGGVYGVDDAVRDPRRRGAGAAELKEVPTRGEVEAVVASLGDDVLAAWSPSPAALADQNASLLRRIAAAARALERRRPALRPHLREFLARQRHANRALAGPLRPWLWIVRRG